MPKSGYRTEVQINFAFRLGLKLFLYPFLKQSFKPSLKPKIMSDRPTINVTYYKMHSLHLRFLTVVNLFVSTKYYSFSSEFQHSAFRAAPSLIHLFT